jgi:hypothetical protein
LLLQVVLTDLPHILALTQENLVLNFPLTSTAAASSSSSSSSTGASSSCILGTFGHRSQAAGQHSWGQHASARAEQPAEAGGCALAVANGETVSNQLQQRATATSASAAFAAAFCSPEVADTQAASQQQSAAQHDWQQQVFAAGPLVVEHCWGEPAEQLQQQVAAAAAVRLQCVASHRALQQLQQEGQTDQQQQQEQQQEHSQQRCSSSLACCSRPFDYVVGADLLYDPAYHQALLTSLQQLCAPHTQVTRRSLHTTAIAIHLMAGTSVHDAVLVSVHLQ